MLKVQRLCCKGGFSLKEPTESCRGSADVTVVCACRGAAGLLFAPPTGAGSSFPCWECFGGQLCTTSDRGGFLEISLEIPPNRELACMKALQVG